MTKEPKRQTPRQIRSAMEKFIKTNNQGTKASLSHLYALVDEFIDLHSIASELKERISENGVQYKIKDKLGNEILKKNECVSSLNQTVQSMVRIQIQLGIKPAGTTSKSGEHELL